MKRYITILGDLISGKPASLRSSHWETVRKHFLKAHPACAACGIVDDLQVHHIKPFHLHPELELDTTNLVVLCENTDNNCHFVIGHHRNWKSENPNVLAEAANKLLSRGIR